MVADPRAIPLQYGVHEMSIAASVLDAVRAESLLHGGARATGTSGAGLEQWNDWIQRPL
jgi:hypothetical protein